MEITCKDIRDNKRITVRVGTEDRVEDLINIISRELGQENSYRLVCCGKIMSETEKIGSYKTSSVLPIIVMVTTPEQLSRYSQQIRLVLLFHFIFCPLETGIRIVDIQSADDLIRPSCSYFFLCLTLATFHTQAFKQGHHPT